MAFKFRNVETGVHFHHTFDYSWYLRSGQKYLIFCRPQTKVARDALRIAMMRTQCPVGWNGILVLTEDHAPPEAVHDSELIFRARRAPDRFLDGRVGEFVDAFNVPVSMTEIAEAMGGPNAFYAAVRLIGAGKFRKTTRGRINYQTNVESVGGAA